MKMNPMKMRLNLLMTGILNPIKKMIKSLHLLNNIHRLLLNRLVLSKNLKSLSIRVLNLIKTNQLNLVFNWIMLNQSRAWNNFHL
jgi:hypothetical protein